MSLSRELRIAFVAVCFVVLVYFVLGSCLPNTWSVQSQQVVPGAPERVLPMLSDFHSWQQWTTVAGTTRSDTKVEVEGDKGTVGHLLRWRSDATEAALRLAVVRSDGVDYEFLSRLGKDSELRVRGRGTLTAVATDGGSTVTWRDESMLDGLTERWFAWFGAQQETARQFQEASLSKLRLQLEAK